MDAAIVGPVRDRAAPGLADVWLAVLCTTRLAMHDERKNKHSNKDEVPKGAVPAYLLDREGVSRAKVRRTDGRAARARTTRCTRDALRVLAFVAGVEQHSEAKTKGEGWQVGGAHPKGEPGDR